MDCRDALTCFLSEEEKKGRLTYKENAKLSLLSSFRIGGEAAFVVYPESGKSLSDTVKALRKAGAYYAVVGNMSNLLFDDRGFDGALVCTKNMKSVSFDGCRVTAEAGVSVTGLAALACERSLSGLEFAYGIPGSVGGAVFMNAGAYGGEMKDVVLSSYAYDPAGDRFVTLCGADHDFGYRHSSYMENEFVIISASLTLKEGSRDEIKAVMQDFMGRRSSKQPLDLPSVGSVFKRCEGHYTGEMIEKSGLKGFSVGGAQVSEKHAGFIVNAGGATAADVLELVRIIKDKVRDNFGVELECEMRYMPYGR